MTTLESKRSDALRRDVDLPLRATFYPIGFRLEIATNSRDVVEAAAETWGSSLAEFEGPAMELRIVVQDEGDLAPETVFRSQRHLFTIVADRDNQATFDPESLFGFCAISAKTAADHAWFRWHFLEAMVYMMLAQRHVVPVHAACMAKNGRGVLLCGASGAGKSTLAYACARAGWTFVGDDTVLLLPDAPEPIALGKPLKARFRSDAPELFPELEGYAAYARPNGKLAMEVPIQNFPEMRTASRCSISAVIFLDRRKGATARASRISSSEVLEGLLREGPDYGEEVFARHEKAIRGIAALPAYRMRYDTLEEAVNFLANLACRECQ